MSPDPLIGSLAAIGAALCWVFTALSFAAAGRRVGSAVVNTTRLVIAVVILILVHRFLFGTWWPEASATSVAWLAVSGIIGLGIGDQLLFQALIDVGSRIPTLLLTLAPPVAGHLARPRVGESLSLGAIRGLAITRGGLGGVGSDSQ
ncbi:MAG: DMT family transporter, partial [Planctomycetota bacterium]|nr:DMT family transporter [Planctomycetota bacterium]